MHPTSGRPRPATIPLRLALLLATVLCLAPTTAAAAIPLDLGTVPTQRHTGLAAYNADVGAALAGACDLDDDGRPDLIVGAQTRNVAGAPLAPGGAYVVFGGRGKLDGDLVLTGDLGKAQHAPRAGAAVACAGDVNGDGVDDALIGAPEYAPVGAAQGRLGAVHVVFGATDLDDLATLDLANLGTRGFTIVGPPGATAGGRLGGTVTPVGDLDGDGLDDIATGAFQLPNGAVATAGAAFVVRGRTATTTVDLATPGAALIQIGGGTASDQVEDIVALGDLTGDDIPELAVSARNFDSLGRTNNGAVFVLDGAAARGALTLGPAPAVPASVLFTVHGGEASESVGVAIAAPGDVNGDDLPDLLLTSNTGAAGTPGYANVVFGAASGDVDLAALGDRGYKVRAPADANGVVRFGAVAAAGDLNGDGRGDLLLGQSTPGRMTLLYGKATTAEQSLGALDAAQGAQLDRGGTSGIGGVVTAPGDVDRNGTPDIAVGGGSGANAYVDVLLLPAATPDPGPGGGEEVETLVAWGVRTNLRNYVYGSSKAPSFVPGISTPPITAFDGAVCPPNPEVAVGGCDPRPKSGSADAPGFKWTPSGAEIDLAADEAVVATRGRVVFDYPSHCFTLSVLDPRWTLKGTEATVSVRLVQDVIEGCSAAGAPGEVARADSDARVTLGAFRVAARTVRDTSVTWKTEQGALTAEGAQVLTLLTAGAELDPATITVPRAIGDPPPLDEQRDVPPPAAPPAVRTVTAPAPAPAARTAPLASGRRLAGTVRGAKTGKRRVAVTLSWALGRNPLKAYRVWLTGKGRKVATGTLEGTTLTLSVVPQRKVTGRGKSRRVRTTYPRLKGSYTLRPAAGGTNLPTVLLKVS